jgi:hypothetical protein
LLLIFTDLALAQGQPKERPGTFSKPCVSVMAGPDPAIHAFLANGTKDVDARHKAGHDELS